MSVQIEISDEDVEGLSDCVEMLIEQHEHAKVHTLSCPSVTDIDMLTTIAADYDSRLAMLRRIETQLGSASV
jgi:hypothetical protein